MKCSNCGRELKRGEREYCEQTYTTACADCAFHRINDTRSVPKYNAWLRGGQRKREVTHA